jgi:hypothetical protein
MQSGGISTAVFDVILHNALDNKQVNRTETFVPSSKSVGAVEDFSTGEADL